MLCLMPVFQVPTYDNAKVWGLSLLFWYGRSNCIGAETKSTEVDLIRRSETENGTTTITGTATPTNILSCNGNVQASDTWLGNRNCKTKR